LPLDAPLLLFPYDPGRAVKRFDLVEAAAELARAAHPALQVITVCDKTPEELALYMNACDVMVLASDSEGAPGAVREALACNLPIVSVDVGDVAELIGPIDGCSIVERDAAAIAAQLNVVLAERRRVDGVVHVQHLDVARSAAVIARIYQELCNDCMSHGRQAV
jgi:glycosyltransferase involved in cell wall biosynthesis